MLALPLFKLWILFVDDVQLALAPDYFAINASFLD
jgi:hypothetical protein